MPRPTRRGPPLATIASITAVVIVFGLSVVGVAWVALRTGGSVALSTPNVIWSGPKVAWSSADDAAKVAASPNVTRSGDGTGRAALSSETAVITPAQAEQLVRDYWSSHEAALVRRDLRRLDRLLTGTAELWQRGAVACDCLRLERARRLAETAYFIPRQTRYPAYFMVEAQTADPDGTPWAELLVFTKRAAGARWLVAHNSGFGPPTGTEPSLGAPLTEADGFLTPVRSATTAVQRRRARTAAADLAEFWRQAKERGTVPPSSTFELSGQTLGRARWLAQSRQDRLQVNGYLGHYRFFVDPADRRFEAAEANGNLLACQVVRETVVYRPLTSTGLIRQDQARKNWGTLLKAGVYRTVTSRSYWQTCFLVPPDPGSAIRVTNQDVGGSLPRGT